MLWMLTKRECWLALVVYLAALVCSASAQQQGHLAPSPQGQLVQPPPYYVQPPPQLYVPPPYYVPQPGVWVPVRRPTAVGQFLFGPIWTFHPTQPPPPPQQ